MPEQKNPTKNVYFFGGGSAEGRAEMKELLGGKGANLAEMTNLGIPVPPGFTISTEVCAAFYERNSATRTNATTGRGSRRRSPSTWSGWRP